MQLHFFTIVLNGMPFLLEQYQVLIHLKGIDWHWHVVEGVADLKLDTAWSVPFGGTIPESCHKDGLSVDGTTSFLDHVQAVFPERVHIYRLNTGKFWNGKLEMVNAPLGDIPPGSLLWQLDADELWTPEQITTIYNYFEDNDDVVAAFFWCNFWVGENLKIVNRRCYGNRPEIEWLRVHRTTPGCKWLSHEPPILGSCTDIPLGRVLSHRETENMHCVFEHHAYTFEHQVAFKESFYGYPGAVEAWKRLQNTTDLPVLLKDYFPWVHDDAIVDRVET
jgi:hypothetical protein